MFKRNDATNKQTNKDLRLSGREIILLKYPKQLCDKETKKSQVEWARNYVPRKSSAFDPTKVRR